MVKKLISAVLLVAVVVGAVSFGFKNVPAVASAEDTISSLEKKQAELQKKSEEYQKILDSNNKKIKEKKKYQQSLVGKIDTVNDEIIVSQEKIAELTKQIDSKTKKIKKLNKEIDERMDTLRGRIKAIYMSGDVSSLEIILGAKDFDDFLDKVELVKNVSRYDEKLINTIKSDMTTVKAERKKLQSSKTKQETEKKNLQNKRDEIQELIDENEEVLDTLYTRNKKQEAAIKANNGALSALDDEISAYYEEKSKKEAAAAKKAAEAAQKAAKEAENNANSGSDNTSSSNNSSSNSSSNKTVVTTGSGYCWPVPGYTSLSSVFGEDRGSYGHGAIDISGSGIMGATVVAADSGTVVVSNNSCTHNWAKSGSCGCGGGYGNYVWIDHGNGKATIYGHLTRAVASQGSTVTKGQVIGYVGSTGWSSGAHLHFECRNNGTRYDPMTEF